MNTAATASKPERVYLLDTHGLIFQMFHAIPAGMSAADGRPTNAVFGVTRAIMDLYDRGADYLLAAFDLSGPTFRNELDPNYKAHRPPTPPDLIIQEPMIIEMLGAMRIPVLSRPGYEADDVIATVAKAGVDRGYLVNLCTSDKDCRQLLGPNCQIVNLRKGEVLDIESLHRDWGVRPEQVIDFQALVGDSVDNVPGVPGCGPKTASKWLQEYGSLEGVIANADKVGGPKLREALKKSIADGTLSLSRQLVALRTDVPITFEWESWKRRPWDGQKLLELCQQFGFRSFAERVRQTLTKSGGEANATLLQTAGHAPPPAPPAGKASRGKPKPGPSLFEQIDAADGATPEPVGPAADEAEWVSHYRLIDSAEAFDSFFAQLSEQKRFVFDLETTSLDPLTATIVGMAVSWKETEASYLAFQGPPGSATLPAGCWDRLKAILEDPAVSKVNQNIKYDLLVLRSRGITLRGIGGDSMIAHYLLHSGARSHNLDDLTREFLGHTNITIDSLIGKGKKQISMADAPTDRVSAYACEDADAALRLTNRFERDMAADSAMVKLYRDVELPLIDVLAELEATGVPLDVPFLAKLGEEMRVQLIEIEERCHALAGQSFNLASPAQLREILFRQMKLPVQKKTGITGEASTDQESLERLAALGHELPKAIIEHRQVAKLKGTYVDALPVLVSPRTGRLHTSFNQTIASTGRLSSSDPNLQNIPTRSDQGQRIRKAFIPREGWQLVTLDYSQVELRLMAHFCGDPNLRQAFADDQDVHAMVAAKIFQTPEAEVTSGQRRVAKMVNFGVIYGISAFGLAARLGMPKAEAGQFIDSYFARYPRVLEYQDNLIRQAKQDGFVATILGRKRLFDPSALRTSSTYHQRSQAEREAINMEIQGSAADLMKLAMLAVHRRLRDDRFEAKMLLTVHDELVFEAPPGEVRKLVGMVRHEMTNAMSLLVPLKVDAYAGPNWLDGEEVE